MAGGVFVMYMSSPHAFLFRPLIGPEMTCFLFSFLQFFFYIYFEEETNIGATIRMGREILCLPYAGFFFLFQFKDHMAFIDLSYKDIVAD